MQYLMQDLLKLSLEDRLFVILNVLEAPETDREKQLTTLIKEKLCQSL